MKYLFVSSIAALICAAGSTVATADDSVPASASVASSAAKSASPSESPTASTCLTETGSRIKPAKGQCIPSASGHSYGSDEIRLTGMTNAGDALRMMDPRITSGGH